jgi:hypothetical protein
MTDVQKTDAQKQESQKTVVAFIFGLIIGGLLVWAFIGDGDHQDNQVDDTKTNETATTSSESTSTTNETTTTPTTETVNNVVVGDGKVTVGATTPGNSVALSAVTYPIEEGWIGVREYTDGKLGYINGVIRFSKAGNISPNAIPLVTPTRSGREYAVVMFTEGGDKSFNSATDRQLDTIFATFKAE